MERTEILNKIQQVLDRMRKWDIDTYCADVQQMNIVNPAFGFKNDGRSSVMSIWMKNGVNDITVKTRPQGYSGPEKRFKTDDLENSHLEAILNMVNNTCEQEYCKRQQAAVNPELEDVIPNIRDWIRKCSVAAGPQYSADVSLGKRSYESEKYHAIVIKENNDQIASISLKQAEDGHMTYNLRTPLGGEWYKDKPLSVKNMFTQIKECFEQITKKNLNIDETADREKLISDVVQKQRTFLEQEMTFMLQVARKDMPVSEKWQLNFHIQTLSAERVDIELLGTRLDGGNDKSVRLASGSFNADCNRPEVTVQSVGEQTAVLEALCRDGQISLLDNGHDTEKGLWLKADVTHLYDKWLKRMNQGCFASPAANILFAGYTRPNVLLSKLKGVTAENTQNNARMKFTIGGMLHYTIACDNKAAKLLQNISVLPQYAFLAHAIVNKFASDKLEQYYNDIQRISDVTAIKNGDKYFMQCSIDGKMQPRKPITEGMFRDWNQAQDRQAADIVLAEFIYSNELLEQQLQQGEEHEPISKTFKDEIQNSAPVASPVTPANTRISDIAIKKNRGNSYFISCHIDGVRQMTEELSFSDQRRLGEVLKNGNAQGLEAFKQSLAEKYYRNALQQEGQEQKSGWKR